MRHKVNIKITLLLTFMLLGTLGAKVGAQDVPTTIKGVVTDEYGKPLQGVVVNSSKGDNGTSTDIEGAYTFTVRDGSDAIVFSYPGYKNNVQSISGKEEINAAMDLDVHRKDEIVQMGFAKQRRGDISGAVSTVGGSKLEKAPVANLGLAMIGQLPGLTVIEGPTSTMGGTGTGSEPSRASVLFYLRGLSNPRMGADTRPAVIVDGILTSYNALESFDLISAREIESITVLKDASTQALYGVKGGQGVIVITTKRGVKGRVNVDVSYNQSVEQPMNTLKRYNSWEYATFQNQVKYNDNPSGGMTQAFSSQDIANYISGENRDLYPNNDYYDMYFRKLATMSRANINITGGSDKFTYFTNVNFMHQSGLFKTTNERYDNGFNYNWFNYRTNVDMKINKYLSAFLRLSGNIKRERMPTCKDNTFQSLYERMWYVPPTQYGPLTPAIVDEESGEVIDAGGQIIINDKDDRPLYALLNRAGFRKRTIVNITSQFGLNLDLGFVTKGLSLSGYMAYQTYNDGMLAGNQWEYPKYIRTNDPTKLAFQQSGNTKTDAISYSKSSSTYYHLDYNATLDYQRTFGKHSVQGMGYMYYQNLSTLSNSNPELFPYNTLLTGFQASYGFDNRYLVKFDIGYTGTEQFIGKQRFVATPSVSGAWVLSNEPFMKGASKWLTEVKFRASYGRTANDDLNMGRFGYSDKIAFGDGGGTVASLRWLTTEEKKGNIDLRAMRMNKQNYGVDFGFLNQLSVSFDYYKERMENMPISATSKIPAYQGIPLGNYPIVQKGVFENKGYELTVNYYKRFNKDWSMNVGGWISYNRNKMIYKDEARKSEGYAYLTREEGFPLGQDFALVWDYAANGNGFYNTQDQLNNSDLTYGWSMPAPGLGDLVYKDMNGDYKIDEKDVVPVGYGAIPQIYYSFGGGFTWKSLEFNIMFQGVGRYAERNQSDWRLGTKLYGIYNTLLEGAWTAERYAAGEKITSPRMSEKTTSSTAQANTFFLEDRAYVRLKNVEIAYTLPLKVSRKISSDKIRFSLSGQNLVTWSRSKSDDYGPDKNANYYTIPQFRVYNIGVSLLF